ncbi:hypothetical protein L9F63_016307, partial [Diploptera punctata]
FPGLVMMYKFLLSNKEILLSMMDQLTDSYNKMWDLLQGIPVINLTSQINNSMFSPSLGGFSSVRISNLIYIENLSIPSIAQIATGEGVQFIPIVSDVTNNRCVYLGLTAYLKKQAASWRTPMVLQPVLPGGPEANAPVLHTILKSPDKPERSDFVLDISLRE